MKKFNRVSKVSKNALLLACVLLISALPVAAYAATAGGGGPDPFSAPTTMFIGWLKGGLGLFLSLIAVGVGLVAGLRAGSIWGVVVGFGVALACFYSPDILQTIFGATLTH